MSFLYHTTKERLEQRNAELQHSVERSTIRLEMQDQELERAREIQQSLLPKEIPQIPGFEVAAAWQPASTVGGDYYDVLRLGEHKLGICIADVVGKGVSAALLMANVQAAVRAFASDAEEPCPALRQSQSASLATTLRRESSFPSSTESFDGEDAYLPALQRGASSTPFCSPAGPYGRMRKAALCWAFFPAGATKTPPIELRGRDRLVSVYRRHHGSVGCGRAGIEEASIANSQRPTAHSPQRVERTGC